MTKVGRIDIMCNLGQAKVCEFPIRHGDTVWGTIALAVQQASYPRGRAREPHHQEATRYIAGVEKG